MSAKALRGRIAEMETRLARFERHVDVAVLLVLEVDLRLVRPTHNAFLPRFAELIYQNYLGEVHRPVCSRLRRRIAAMDADHVVIGDGCIITDSSLRRCVIGIRRGSDGVERSSSPFKHALTSLIGLTVQPMLTFFMGRAPAPVESLAVFPVVHSLSFLFRAVGLSFQEAAIALLGKRAEHAPELTRFATGLGLAAAAGLALVAFTPLADVWFITVSGLAPDLAAFAIAPTRILAIFPALTVLLSYQRAILVQGRRTRPITIATALEVAGVAIVFTALGGWVELVGVTAAVLAFVAGRLVSVSYLAGSVRRTLPRMRA